MSGLALQDQTAPLILAQSVAERRRWSERREHARVLIEHGARIPADALDTLTKDPDGVMRAALTSGSP